MGQLPDLAALLANISLERLIIGLALAALALAAFAIHVVHSIARDRDR